MAIKRYSNLINFFGVEWFNDAWHVFQETRSKYPRDSLSKDILLLELKLHPIHKEIFKWQGIKSKDLDFSKIPLNGGSDYILSHLDRDIALLSTELATRGNKIKRDLMEAMAFENHRFTLLVGAGYKLLGNTVEFVPSSSAKGKTPDLLINKKLFIECKQRNQEISDLPRYMYLGELAEKYLRLLRIKGSSGMFINITDQGNLDGHKALIEAQVEHYIWRKKTPLKTRNTSVDISSLSAHSDFVNILLEGHHFQGVPVFSRTEDAFIVSDPLNKNVIMLNKSIDMTVLSQSVFELLKDADDKIKGSNKLIVYFDLGRAPTDWISQLADYIHLGGGLKAYSNVDTFIICRTALLYKGERTEIRPHFNTIGYSAKLGSTPERLNLFGGQGKTGMDHYFIQGFVLEAPPIISPGTKYIQCPLCHYKLTGITTNLDANELLSQAQMPCPSCGGPMDMTLKVF